MSKYDDLPESPLTCGMVRKFIRFVSLSNEFKSKWDSQKAALLSQKKTEIDTHLQREDELAQADFAKTAAPWLDPQMRKMCAGCSRVSGIRHWPSVQVPPA